MEKGDILGKVEVHKGDIPYIEAVLEKDSYILLPKGNSGNISKEILLPEFLESPINEGQEIGQMIVKLDGVEVDRIKLVSKAKADKAGFKEMFKKTLKNFLINK